MLLTIVDFYEGDTRKESALQGNSQITRAMMGVILLAKMCSESGAS